MDQTEAFVKKHNLIKKKDKILIAFSGGPDSIYLTKKLLAMRESMELTLYCLHVNHQIQAEADEHAAFARRFCNEHGITYYEFCQDIPALARERKQSLELAGREYRYEMLYKMQEALSCDSIAVAHHMNDQAETLLYRMARGTGIRGMTGMLPRQGDIIRPLLSISKEQILLELESENQTFNVDCSNEETDYVRNHIRHLVVPKLLEVNEKATQHMAELATDMAELQAYLRPQVKEACHNCIRENEISIDRLNQYPVFMQKEILREALIAVSGRQKDLTRQHIEALIALKDRQSGRQMHFPYGVMAMKEYNRIVLHRDLEEITTYGEYEIDPCKQDVFELEDWNAALSLAQVEKPKSNCEKIYTKYFSYDKINKSMMVRSARPGDYFIMNQSGQKKKLNRYFIDQKIPKQDRGKIPVLAAGSHVIWIIGGRISEAYKVTPDTKTVIEISWIERKR